ncbi:uncharacterized protein CBL_02295 [Carabus blaptoides fortunei]
MRTLVVFVVCILVAVWAADEAPKDGERPKTFKRLIPADVLRDFPGMCFASTKCATVEPLKTWELSPFCGRSTCVLSEDKPPRLLELVEDCGPLPLANPKCKLDEEKTKKTAPFPGCCPVFICEDGAKLEYPEIPTVAPVPAEEATTPKA